MKTDWTGLIVIVKDWCRTTHSTMVMLSIDYLLLRKF